jgi:hypothetical protein
MNDVPPFDPNDTASCAVRALVLYSLAEFQAGYAMTLRVTAEGYSFGIARKQEPQLDITQPTGQRQ